MTVELVIGEAPSTNEEHSVDATVEVLIDEEECGMATLSFDCARGSAPEVEIDLDDIEIEEDIKALILKSLNEMNNEDVMFRVLLDDEPTLILEV